MRRVVKVLCKISIDIIKWPSINEINNITEKFKQIAGLKHVLGAIDGTHIEIPAPSVSIFTVLLFYLVHILNNENMYLLQIDIQCYLTRKCRYAVILQAICNADLLFTDCEAGYPGSVSDIRVFRNSNFWHNVNRNYRFFFLNEEFIIGDKAYPLCKWCLTAYRDNGHLTQINCSVKKLLLTYFN